MGEARKASDAHWSRPVAIGRRPEGPQMRIVGSVEIALRATTVPSISSTPSKRVLDGVQRAPEYAERLGRGPASREEVAW
jgi:hypothetical protein